MAIMVTLTLGGVPVDVFDQINEELGAFTNPPAGLIVHLVYSVDVDAVRVVDVWLSEEEHDAFENLLTIHLPLLPESFVNEVSNHHDSWAERLSRSRACCSGQSPRTRSEVLREGAGVLSCGCSELEKSWQSESSTLRHLKEGTCSLFKTPGPFRASSPSYPWIDASAIGAPNADDTAETRSSFEGPPTWQ